MSSTSPLSSSAGAGGVGGDKINNNKKTVPSQAASATAGGGGVSLSSVIKKQCQPHPPPAYSFSPGEIHDKTLATIEDFASTIWTPDDGSKVLPHHAVADMDSSHVPSLSLIQAVSGKTREDMWDQIQPIARTVVVNGKHNSNSHSDHHHQHQQQQQQQAPPQLSGEVTLEDFLLRTGVVKEDVDDDAKVDLSLYAGNPSLHPGFLQNSDISVDWMMNNLSTQQHVLQQPSDATGGGGGPSLLPGHPHEPGAVPGGLPLVTSFSDCSLLSRKRGASPVVESSVQRRQKRMIKNRESAARSRARRQAYTVELEAEVSQLKAENARLKKIQALEDSWRKAMYKQQSSAQESSARVLRRTRSW